VVVPADDADQLADADGLTPLTPGYDFPSPVADQVRWLTEVGLRARVSWLAGDLAVIVADAS
jgi:hypothetical protein